MLELEEKAAASASAAQFERERSLRLEDDLGRMRAHLGQVKKEAALHRQTTERSMKESSLCLDSCRKGIRAMTQRIFGKRLAVSDFATVFLATVLTSLRFPSGMNSTKLQFNVGQQMNELLDFCHGLQEGARAIVRALHPKDQCPKQPEQLVGELSKAPAHL